MGLLASLAFHAGNRDGTDRRNDREKASQAQRRAVQEGPATRLRVALCLLLALVLPAGLRAETLRLAHLDADLTAEGPGVLLAEITEGESVRVLATIAQIDAADADILLLTDFDYDHGLVALAALNQHLARPYPHLFALRPNSGTRSGFDLDGDGRLAGPADAVGFGFFSGQGGMAILSRHKVDLVTDFTPFLWQDLPGASLPEPLVTSGASASLPLSAVGHWDLQVLIAGKPLRLLAYAASPPLPGEQAAFNFARNADQTRFWSLYLAGALGMSPPNTRFVLIGRANIDPVAGDGAHEVIATLLADPVLQDPQPRDADGSPATAIWPDGPGALRVDYILPSRDLSVLGAGLIRPGEGGSAHALVHVDLVWE